MSTRRYSVAALLVVAGLAGWIRELNAAPDPTSARAKARTATTLADGLWGPTAVAVDATHVYFVTLGDGKVGRVPRAGGRVHWLASKQVEPMGLAVDGTYVYWLARGDWKAAADNGALMRVAKAGGKPEVMVPGLRFPRGLVVDATDVWLIASHDVLDSLDVLRIPKAGGTPEVVWSGGGGMAIAANTKSVFVGLSDRSIRVIAKRGGATAVVAKAASSSIAADDKAVYAIGLDGLTRWPLEGGASAKLASESFDDVALRGELVVASIATRFRSDGDALVPAGDGQIVVVPITPDGELVPIVERQVPTALAIEGNEVFWTNGVGRKASVRKARLP